MNKTKVYNVIIMDKSGSMWDIQRPAIQGYNEVLGGVKAAAQNYKDTQEQFITLVLFDSNSIENVYWNADPSKAEHLTDKTYVPGAATPLYDAMGKTLSRLRTELADDNDHSVAVTVITDGLENSSHEYSLSAIKAMVENLKKTDGWSFAYMGTDHDVTSVTTSLSITNIVMFEKSAEGTAGTFEKEKRARERYSKKWNDFLKAAPCASAEEKTHFRQRLADDYYKED